MSTWVLILLPPVLALIFWYYRLYRLQSIQTSIHSLKWNDVTIAQKKQQAQDQLFVFLALAEKHGYNQDRCQFFIKAVMEENNHREHLWVQVTSFNGTVFRGTLANDPSTLQHVKFGDSLMITKDEVEDWQVLDFLTGKRHGGFSRKYVRSNK
ncbi:DUF2314 domain-containing protein [Phnomibacter sp. MR]|uniref:DUF2314 domain-containing protein n=1 Tax=Phnomibacter sp. MR TaxID=3042318 RepID=UPI003A813E1B